MNIKASVNAPTAYGLLAVLLWSTVVGLVRYVTEQFTPLGGTALVDTLGALLLLVTVGLPDMRAVSRTYLLVGGSLFVICEIGLALALGFSHSRTEAMEVGVINYFWPSLTILFSIFMNRKKVKIFIVPGIILATFGVIRVLGGEGVSFSFSALTEHFLKNPLCYSLAFLDAVVWALYSALTPRFAKDQNAVALFFVLAAILLWILYFLLPGPLMLFPMHALPDLVLASVALGLGYGFWNIGLLRGNTSVIIPFSYFTPVLSSIFAACWLKTSLGWSFWEGVMMVTVGALFCFSSLHSKRNSTLIVKAPELSKSNLV